MDNTLFKQLIKVSRQDREQLTGSKSFTIWLTGLSGAGKSTMGIELEQWLHNKGKLTYVLDGDNTRMGINRDLSFSEQDRMENIRRVAEICKLFNEAGVIVIACLISPFTSHRAMAKNIIGEESFVEVYLEASVATCQERDCKGLYKLAVAGKIKDFTGISSPYEAPTAPDLKINTERKSPQETLLILQTFLSDKGYVSV